MSLLDLAEQRIMAWERGRRGGRTDNCGGGGEIWPAWFNTLQSAQIHWNTYSQNTDTKGEMWPAWFDALFAALYKTLLDQMCSPWKSAATNNVRFNVWRLPLCPLCRVSLQSQPPLFSSFVPSSCQRRQWGLSWCGVITISMWWRNEFLRVIRCWPVLSIFYIHLQVKGLCNMGL